MLLSPRFCVVSEKLTSFLPKPGSTSAVDAAHPWTQGSRRLTSRKTVGHSSGPQAGGSCPFGQGGAVALDRDSRAPSLCTVSSVSLLDVPESESESDLRPLLFVWAREVSDLKQTLPGQTGLSRFEILTRSRVFGLLNFCSFSVLTCRGVVTPT